MKEEAEKVPLYHKYALTLEEASIYFNIGINKLRELIDDEASECRVYIGKKRLIKKKRLEDWLDQQEYI